MSSTAPARNAGTKARFSDMSPRRRAGVLALASIQLALAVSAWVDLATRPAEKVEGSKLKWALIIAVNFVGPISYFRAGRRS
ncbi:PLDc_N domain-containing protein [Rhodococcus sp. HNM0563]|uniref:PLDc N-terminal domain-containing protein n=1 Tax=Rhodococcus sp. HNM0563 TaxID=2716339 RepID=UPI00146EFED4|nr:PLDc N-terminal domain-containing protein [Rhodococcus sp. HNM0563]NLU65112.1 PLDc_N domain-containing protein [Rhodococcus sp. HNM0563]